MSYEVQHECTQTESGFWQILSECGDAAGSSAGVWGVVIGVIVLGAAGVGIWWLVSKRNQ